MLSRTEILSIVPDLRRETVQVESWGGDVHVREMNGTERDRFELLLLETKRANFRALLAAFAVCDEAGVRVFGEADVGALAKQPARVLDPISAVALRLNALTEAEVESAAKNSESGPIEGSS